ncbi:hypothetical protein TWF730_002094 [Orbilia blumenaviensis]|uniref:Uncharacterized protein n=1 Tax=Orbilia blumenaviensis TaxID=1796055 RepID=A0AAV9UGZ1_9PEZI
MAPATNSSSSSSFNSHLLTPSYAVPIEDGKITAPASRRRQLPQSNDSNCSVNNIRGKRILQASESEELPNHDEVEDGPGTRSCTPPVEDSSQSSFFGLSQEYSFTQNENDDDTLARANPLLQSFVESLPETAFSESRPQSGRSGLDRYLATPRRGDAVRYFYP